jgi:Tol biopolymer transport system component
MSRRHVAVALAVTSGVLAIPASAAVIPHRTLPLSVTNAGAPLDGPASDGDLSGAATVAAFTTTATNFGPAGDPNGAVADIVTIDLPSGRRRLVSEALDGTGADGPSRSPVLSASGLRVAFVSDASNLVEGDSNGVADIFVRDRDGAFVRASVADDESEADGPSSQPDISADGRIVAFTSSATNLVPGDTNGQPDVFVRDLERGTTRRVSVASSGAQAGGPSSAPAVDADGSAIAFESSAADLVAGDTNGVADVFVHASDGRTERVSISSSGRQQDKAISAPYAAAPDISGDGRYVVFDSDARTLYAGDTNLRTDVYLRDRRRKVTTLVSASSLNVQGNNDSITPRITSGGRFVTFQSFATNLVPADGPREDLFVRDLRNRTTALVNATDSGARRDGEPGPGQLLQRAAISDDARSAVFLSGSANMTATETLGPRRLFLRTLVAPDLRIIGPIGRAGREVRFTVGTGDPAATRFLCRVDQAVPFYCGPRVSVRRNAGRVLSVRAGGPGMLWSAAKKVPLGSG